MVITSELIKLFYCGSGGASSSDRIAQEEGWLAGIRSGGKYKAAKKFLIYFVDNDWKNYNHPLHLKMFQNLFSEMATAQNICSVCDLPRILREAEQK